MTTEAPTPKKTRKARPQTIYRNIVEAQTRLGVDDQQTVSDLLDALKDEWFATAS